MRQFALTTAKGGINRLRDKGNASKDSLYDLLNGYVTQTNSIKPRPGTRLSYSLPTGTKGLCAFHEKLHVFSSEVVTSLDAMVVINVLRHPTSPLLPLLEIHFAAPFLGYLYVAAEWLNGDVFHYWLQENNPWQADHVYLEGEIVQPTITKKSSVRKAAPTKVPRALYFRIDYHAVGICHVTKARGPEKRG